VHVMVWTCCSVYRGPVLYAVRSIDEPLPRQSRPRMRSVRALARLAMW
jgi:hypothetical protein